MRDPSESDASKLTSLNQDKHPIRNLLPEMIPIGAKK
jgi:hypothetical protein